MRSTARAASSSVPMSVSSRKRVASPRVRPSAIEVVEVHARPVHGRRGIALVVALADAIGGGADLAGLGEHLATVLEPVANGGTAARFLHASDLGVGDLV